jgi:hypothetical protein
MAELTFRCPTTGTDVASGLETDPDTRSQIRLFRLRILCPACGDSHEFSIGEARTDTVSASAQGTPVGLGNASMPRSRRRHLDFKPRWLLN